MKRKAITISENEEFLRQISQNVEFKDKNLTKEIQILEEYCKENSVLAMAAVQLGIPKRIIYVKNTDLEKINNASKEELNNDNEAKVLINPVMMKREGLTSYWESCASCLDYFGLVKRPYKIKIEYYDRNFQKKQEIIEGFPATVLSHEIDHLDGILHIDIAEKILIKKEEERRMFRKQKGNGYIIYQRTGKYEDLLIGLEKELNQ